ncbi:hypothetical protein [Streptomyces chrestomyceticus]|uniref:hypothetical protein n=1 Tax=Streptomyces chrestomyceticus TaxID=68185 RepID=UPI0004C82802
MPARTCSSPRTARCTHLAPALATAAGGAFICGTACEPLSVARIDDHHHDLTVTEAVRKLITGYRDLVEGRRVVGVPTVWAR